MAVAQVSLVSAVRAAPAARATRASSKARAVKVVAKAGVERVELAKKASAVAISVGACPRIDVLVRRGSGRGRSKARCHARLQPSARDPRPYTSRARSPPRVGPDSAAHGFSVCEPAGAGFPRAIGATRARVSAERPARDDPIDSCTLP